MKITTLLNKNKKKKIEINYQENKRLPMIKINKTAEMKRSILRVIERERKEDHLMNKMINRIEKKEAEDAILKQQAISNLSSLITKEELHLGKKLLKKKLPRGM